MLTKIETHLIDIHSTAKKLKPDVHKRWSVITDVNFVKIRPLKCNRVFTLLWNGIWSDQEDLSYHIEVLQFSQNSCLRELPGLQMDHMFFLWRQMFNFWASLVVQWLRICLPMQGTRVRALVWEDPTCRGATGPVSHNYWACASGACAPQQETPRQWKARAPQWRVAPACRN